MNCRENDLAILIEDLWLENPLSGERKTLLASGALVRCVSLDPIDNCWNIEEPRRISLMFEQAPRIRIDCVLSGIRDDVLRPIRDPGDEAVDEMVRLAGPAPMTLTELLRGEETAHG